MCIIRLLLDILEAPNVQPPIVPDVAFSTPALVTLNGALAKLALPICIPVPGVSATVVDVLPPVSAVSDIVNPPIVPDSAFNTPAGVTLNGALPNVACPNCIPSSASAIKIVFPLPIERALLVVFKTKLVAVKLSEPILNPPIVPPASAVIVPCITTSPSGCRWKLLDVISILPFEPLIKLPASSLPKKNLDVLTSKDALLSFTGSIVLYLKYDSFIPVLPSCISRPAPA